MNTSLSNLPIERLRTVFGDHLQENVVLANYTTARVGGSADAALMVYAASELENAARRLWEMDIPFFVLGSGSNVLISDAGVHTIVIINHAHTVKIDVRSNPPSVWCESGANIGGAARQVALRGLSGLEWAVSIPGTVGGAIYGNAGAHDGDIQGSLLLADILHRQTGKAASTSDQLEFGYRTSILKQNPGQAIVLSARFKLSASSPDAVHSRMEEFTNQRHKSQPTGASMGSMFKNPPGDYAGRLIEAAGLKGARIGGVEISPVHANFFINDHNAKAADIWKLIRRTQKKVAEKFGIQLELEIELLGNWQDLEAEDKAAKKPSQRKQSKK